MSIFETMLGFVEVVEVFEVVYSVVEVVEVCPRFVEVVWYGVVLATYKGAHCREGVY